METKRYVHYKVMRKLSDERQQLATLKKALVRYEGIFENADVVIYTLDRSGRFVDINRKAEELTGFKRSQWIGRSFKDIVDKSYVKAALETFLKVIRGHTTTSKFLIRGKAARKIWVEVKSNPIYEKGKIVGAEGIARDITKTKEIEESLLKSEERYRSLLQNSVEGIIAADIKTKKFCYANPAICNMLGYTEEELRKLGVHDIHPKNALKHVIGEFEAQARREKSLATNIPFLKKNGTILYADVNTTPILIDGKKCNLGFITDITDKKRMEEENLRLSSLAAIGAFSASIAHEIRNPLFSISTIAQLMEPEFKNSPNWELFSAMSGEIKRLKEFIDNMLFFSRPQKISLGRVEPEKIIRGILFTNKKLLDSKKIKVRIRAPLRGPLIKKADPSQIRRLFLNLLLNAVEASPRGGTVTVNIKKATEKGKLEISFHNRGKHIRKQNIDSLFDLFYSTKPKGCGLGLPISKKIVEAHKGTVKVTSSKKQGTIFTVQL